MKVLRIFGVRGEGGGRVQGNVALTAVCALAVGAVAVAGFALLEVLSGGGSGSNPQAVPTCWIVEPEAGGFIGEQSSVRVGYRAREVAPGRFNGVVERIELWVDGALVDFPEKSGQVIMQLHQNSPERSRPQSRRG